MKALDFADYVTEHISLYNVCRARAADQTTCGLAYPSKLWKQAPLGAWTFYCGVDWSKLVSAAEPFEEGNPLKNWTTHLVKKIGEDFNKWPAIGCGTKSMPSKSGEWQVAELRLEDGTWTAFSADRMPTDLDDEMKRAHAELYKASQHVTPEDLKDVIPMTFRMTNLME